MKTISFLVSAVMLCAQTTDPNRPQPGARFDPFSNEKAAAVAAENEWTKIDNRLDNDLKQVHPCSNDARQKIASVRSAALACFVAKGQYYKKWMDSLVSDEKTNDRLVTEHQSLRDTQEKDLSNIRARVDNTKTRRSALEQTLQGNGVSSAPPLKTLDTEISELNKRLDLAQTGVYHSDQIQKSRADAKAKLQAEQASVADLQRTLGTESLTWQAVYDAYEARRYLDCLQNSGPDPLGPRDPGKRVK